MNSVNLIGRLAFDLEIRYTNSGKTVLNNRLAVERTYNRLEQEADFFDIVAWNKTAELMSQYCKKGSQIGVTGRLQQRQYENSQGQKVNVVEIVVNEVRFLDKKDEQAQQTNYDSHTGNAPAGNIGQQIANQVSTNAFASQPAFSNAHAIEVKDDDLPF